MSGWSDALGLKQGHRDHDNVRSRRSTRWAGVSSRSACYHRVPVTSRSRSNARDTIRQPTRRVEAQDVAPGQQRTLRRVEPCQCIAEVEQTGIGRSGLVIDSRDRDLRHPGSCVPVPTTQAAALIHGDGTQPRAQPVGIPQGTQLPPGDGPGGGYSLPCDIGVTTDHERDTHHVVVMGVHDARERQLVPGGRSQLSAPAASCAAVMRAPGDRSGCTARTSSGEPTCRDHRPSGQHPAPAGAGAGSGARHRGVCRPGRSRQDRTGGGPMSSIEAGDLTTRDAR